MRLLFNLDWLRKKIASDPDVPCEAGPDTAGPDAREKAAQICEQIAVNLRANAIKVTSDLLRRELKGCAETADQCALSIRFGKVTGASNTEVQSMPKRIV